MIPRPFLHYFLYCSICHFTDCRLDSGLGSAGVASPPPSILYAYTFAAGYYYYIDAVVLSRGHGRENDEWGEGQARRVADTQPKGIADSRFLLRFVFYASGQSRWMEKREQQPVVYDDRRRARASERARTRTTRGEEGWAGSCCIGCL